MFAKEAYGLMENCAARKIPYVIINTNLEKAKPLCYIGQDSYQSGVLGARLLNFGLGAEGEVCILNLDFSTKAAHHLIRKERGFRDYFKEIDNKKVKIIREDFDRFEEPEALRLFMTGLFEKYTKLRGIFVTNSRAYKVLQCAEKLIKANNIKLVGFDLVEPNLAFLKENKINFIINQNPKEQGFRGVYSLFKYLIQKEEVEKTQYLPLDIIVKENVDYYLKKMTGVGVVL